MDAYWDSVPFESSWTDSWDELPNTEEPVYILGETYSALYDRVEIKEDIESKIWITYRKGFSPIGGPGGNTSDSGWGCMHRCGQMMLAQALVHIHLGRKWRWRKNQFEPKYWKILQLFQDNKSAPYSIHAIASSGISEGKNIGKWFGPNTVAQVLKKLSIFDRWTQLKVHIVMEDGVIIDEIKELCRRRSRRNSDKSTRHSHQQQPNSGGSHDNHGPPASTSDGHRGPRQMPITKELDEDCVEIVFPPAATNSPPRSTAAQPPLSTPRCGQQAVAGSSPWQPLLLIIPLRLGLQDLNPCYISAIKAVFHLPQCVGILGGRPSHALWFIGCVGDELLYLDPHTNQPVTHLNSVTEMDADDSYHCLRPGRLPIIKLDPSIALGFVCPDEASLQDLCERLTKEVLRPAKDPMFEIHQRRPPHLPPLAALSLYAMGGNGAGSWSLGATVKGSSSCESDEDFELL